MKTYGIICEYNPFHNGHIYQIEETRKHGADHIVAIMSGNYVQRGDLAVIDKFKRAQIAVNHGADLVIEMPVAYSLANAEMFARAGVMMLGALGCVDGISFGSECGDISLLKNAADAALASGTPEKIKPLLEQGIPYPEALQQSILREHGPIIAGAFDGPNNILGIEYLKAMKVLGIEMDAFTIKRKGADHDSSEASENIASASKLREMIENMDDISAYVPEDMAEAIKEYDDAEHIAYFDNLERQFLFMLRTVSPQIVAATPDVGQGLENRIVQAGRSAVSLDQFLELCDTKRYTMARFRRILLNLFLGIKKTDLQVPPAYGRVLAFNEKGVEIIKAAAEQPPEKIAIPFSVSLKEILEMKIPPVMRQAELTCRSSDLYMLASREIRTCASDFTAKIEIQK